MTTVFITCLCLALLLTQAADVHPMEPKELTEMFTTPIKAHLSPIGYRPLSGRLEGSVILANPKGACSKIKDINSDNEDFFVLADDSECLESVKAKNIAASGGYAGIIKQNSNNTLFDKQISLVHIPILQIAPKQYDLLEDYLKKHNSTKIALSIDFTDDSQTHPINVEFWFSPTQAASYEFLISMRDFLIEQPEQISFTPHYVLQSQRETKNYIGCLSSGRYCPSEIQFEGKYEGKNIVEETLRQIIIWDIDQKQWWKYTKFFYENCLKDKVDIFLNSTQLQHCSQNALIMAGVKNSQLMQEYNNSFLGSRKQVDDNTYLLEERQLFIREQVKTHPAVLVNKKMQAVDSQMLRQRICKMQGDAPTSYCSVQVNQLSTKQVLIILAVIMALFVAVGTLYRLYMHIRMRREIKGQVDKTLEQYYRYIETFEEDNNNKLNKPKKEKSIKLTEQLEQVPEVEAKVQEVEVQMTAMERQE